MTIVQEIDSGWAPGAIAQQLQHKPGLILCSGADSEGARYAMVAADPFLVFRSTESRCEWFEPESNRRTVATGNPWQVLGERFRSFALEHESDFPFPLGGCFGFWGYDLKEFVEATAQRSRPSDLGIPDCQVGFYDSLLVKDRRLNKSWIVSTGFGTDRRQSTARARTRLEDWLGVLNSAGGIAENRGPDPAPSTNAMLAEVAAGTSSMTRAGYIAAVAAAQRYIRAGDIYQVKLSHRLATPWSGTGFELYERLAAVSPAPHSAFMNFGEFQIVSSSPELFLKLSDRHVITRPIKGTRPRSRDQDVDARLHHELMTSPKEAAELVMITDLLRNDLGRICEFGSVRVPEMARVERYAHVQHLVSTVEGRLREGVDHLSALAACFPGGSVTGAPKIRAMQIIDELESVPRGPYTGALGYLGFNRESQLSIVIRTAVLKNQRAHFHVGAGIVADSIPEAEYEETLAKAGGFLDALRFPSQRSHSTRE